jgi:hypothetical protein
MHQITPSKKYVIPIYNKIGYPIFQSFPAPFGFSPDEPKIQRISKMYKGKMFQKRFLIISFKIKCLGQI